MVSSNSMKSSCSVARDSMIGPAPLAVLAESSSDSLDRVDLLNRIEDETRQILDLVSEMARDVATFLEAAEL
jgi:hypothetical protein